MDSASFRRSKQKIGDYKRQCDAIRKAIRIFPECQKSSPHNWDDDSIAHFVLSGLTTAGFKVVRIPGLCERHETANRGIECAWCGADIRKLATRCANDDGEAFCTFDHRGASNRARDRFLGRG